MGEREGGRPQNADEDSRFPRYTAAPPCSWQVAGTMTGVQGGKGQSGQQRQAGVPSQSVSQSPCPKVSEVSGLWRLQPLPPLAWLHWAREEQTEGATALASPPHPCFFELGPTKDRVLYL